MSKRQEVKKKIPKSTVPANGRPCRVCKKVPEYYHFSRALRYDFICPTCSIESLQKSRVRRRELLELCREAPENN